LILNNICSSFVRLKSVFSNLNVLINFGRTTHLIIISFINRHHCWVSLFFSNNSCLQSVFLNYHWLSFSDIGNADVFILILSLVNGGTLRLSNVLC
jgi:hypothetical protein